MSKTAVKSKSTRKTVSSKSSKPQNETRSENLVTHSAVDGVPEKTQMVDGEPAQTTTVK